jgi:hypothetical protein
MMVHAATAPAAVLRTLPALPPELAGPSLDAAWAATAAVTAAYSPSTPDPGRSPTTEHRPGDLPSAHDRPDRAAAGGPPSTPDPASRVEAGDPPPTPDPHEVFDRAVSSGDAHAIKFADAAVEAWQASGDPVLLSAAIRATDLIGPG